MPSFFDVLTAAVRDMTEHGFDSQARVDRWIAAIHEAALRSLTPPHILEQALRSTLATVYARQIERGGILRYHPGVPAYTLRAVKPALRAELDRRIMASAELIRLNRASAIQSTLQRFAGWSSSIPAGGSRAVATPAVKTGIRRSLAQLPFIERRVAIDQGHKFLAALNAVVAEGGGALAVRWVSHWRQAGYDYRPDHKDRDGRVYAIRGNWALENGLMKPNADGYSDQITQFGEEVNCFPGDSQVPFADGVEVGYRRWYSGDMIELLTVSGRTLRATPNHPVLTPSGWRAIGSLNEGDDLIEIGEQCLSSSSQYKENTRIPMIEQIFGTLNENGVGMQQLGVDSNFHGDGADGQVNIVRAARPLQIDFTQRGSQFALTNPDHSRARVGTLGQRFGGRLGAAHGIMSSDSELLATLMPYPLHADDICFATSAHDHALASQIVSDECMGRADPTTDRQGTLAGQVSGNYSIFTKRRVTLSNLRGKSQSSFAHSTMQATIGDTQQSGDFMERFPFSVQTSRIVKIDRQFWSGHVYNLQTLDGYYSVNGVIVHNCRCFGVYLYHVRRLPDDMITKKGRDQLAALAT